MTFKEEVGVGGRLQKRGVSSIRVIFEVGGGGGGVPVLRFQR